MPAATLDEPETELRHAPAAATTASLPQRVVLTGFMGAGKSTVGTLLAQQLGWRFIDVDREIEERAGLPVQDIFARLGEFVFRRMETAAIAHALGERFAVIALGGGAPEVLANRLLLEQTPRTAVVLLEAPLQTLLARCDNQATGEYAPVRPILSDRASAEERFRYRGPLYRRVARHVVQTDGRTPSQTADDVARTAGLDLHTV